MDYIEIRLLNLSDGLDRPLRADNSTDVTKNANENGRERKSQGGGEGGAEGKEKFWNSAIAFRTR